MASILTPTSEIVVEMQQLAAEIKELARPATERKKGRALLCAIRKSQDTALFTVIRQDCQIIRSDPYYCYQARLSDYQI